MRVGDLVRYNNKTMSVLMKLDYSLLGIVKKVHSQEFVVVLWSDGAEKMTFIDFLEVLDESFE